MLNSLEMEIEIENELKYILSSVAASGAMMVTVCWSVGLLVGPPP